MTQTRKPGFPLGRERMCFNQAVPGNGLTSDTANAGSEKNGLDASPLVRKIKRGSVSPFDPCTEEI
jgi:hypothetical protein